MQQVVNWSSLRHQRRRHPQHITSQVSTVPSRIILREQVRWGGLLRNRTFISSSSQSKQATKIWAFFVLLPKLPLGCCLPYRGALSVCWFSAANVVVSWLCQPNRAWRMPFLQRSSSSILHGVATRNYSVSANKNHSDLVKQHYILELGALEICMKTLFETLFMTLSCWVLVLLDTL